MRSGRPAGMWAIVLWAILVLAAALVGVGCDADAPRAKAVGAGATTTSGPTKTPSFSGDQRRQIARLSPMGPPPANPTNAVADDPRAARLGQFLFFDTRLSADQTVSCATCHQPDHGFSMPAALGAGLGETDRHPPTLLNAAYHHWYDWDGRADTMWAQAFGPLENPDEMGTSRSHLAHLVARDGQLRQAYETIFGPLPDLADHRRFPADARPVEAAPSSAANQHWRAMQPADRRAVNRVASNLTKSIGAYQRRLIRVAAPFDTFVEGLRRGDVDKQNAIGPAAQRGVKLFVGKAGCVRCHSGPAMTDESFHNLGLGGRPWLAAADQGRWGGVGQVKDNPFNAAGRYSDDRNSRRAKWLTYLAKTTEDHGQFKTPSLRNVALTAPYMHGGHFETLAEVVRFYTTLDEQAAIGHREDLLEPLALSAAERADLVAFLGSLTGRPLADHLRQKPPTPLLP